MRRTSSTRNVIAALALAGVVLGACGGGDDGDDGEKSASTGEKSASIRTIEVEMHDIAYSPDQVEVRAGETVRFVFRNTGKIKHDAFIGDEAAQGGHEQEMREAEAGDDGMEGMEGSGSEDQAVTIDPGGTEELMRTFRKGDQLLIGCHQLGHYAAGMKLTITVG